MDSSTTSLPTFLQEFESRLEAPYPFIHVETFEEQRAISLVESIADDLDRHLYEWTLVTDFDGSSNKRGLMQALADIEEQKEPGIFVLKDVHSELEKPRTRRKCRELVGPLMSGGHSVIFLSPEPIEIPELEKDIVSLELPLPNRDSLEKELEIVFSEKQLTELNTDSIVQNALGLTSNEAHRAFHRVKSRFQDARKRNLPFEPQQEVLKEKKQLIEQSDIIEFIIAERSLDELGGLEMLKKWVKNRKEAFSEEARRYGLPFPKGLLLLGVQGCGKSLTSKVIARHWELPLLRLDLGVIFDGNRSADQALRSSIDMATSMSPCVLWIDEIEKGFSENEGGRTERVLGQLLTWQQEKDDPVFLVATANSVDNLPPEMLRKGRFDDIFFLDLPDRHARREILEIHLRQKGVQLEDEGIDKLASKTEFFSGAELEQVIVSGMYTAFSEDRDPDFDDLKFAAEQTVPLYRTYEEDIKKLRQWAHGRARPASQERKLIDFFSQAT
jgi:AAA+ superfamily predicted ATPase